MWQSKGPFIAMPASYKYPPSSEESEKQQRPSVYTAEEHVDETCFFLSFPLFSHLLSPSLLFIFLSFHHSICYCLSLTFFSILPLSPFTCLPSPHDFLHLSVYLVWPPTSSLTCPYSPVILFVCADRHCGDMLGRVKQVIKETVGEWWGAANCMWKSPHPPFHQVFVFSCLFTSFCLLSQNKYTLCNNMTHIYLHAFSDIY